MKLTVYRKWFLDDRTISQILVDGIPFCYGLEDKDRGLFNWMTMQEIYEKKVVDETAIPYGTYRVILDYSPHFQRIMPHIVNVPGFSGVRIHWGNYPKDTEGCLLVGTTLDNPADPKIILQSVGEFNHLMSQLRTTWDEHEQISITYMSEEAPV